MAENVNTVKPKVTELDLGDGIVVSLVFDLNAFAAVEDDYPSTEAAFKAMEDGSLKALRTVLTAAINSGQPTDPMTPEQVGALVSVSNMKTVTEALAAALKDAMPDKAPKGGKGGNAPTPAAG